MELTVRSACRHLLWWLLALGLAGCAGSQQLTDTLSQPVDSAIQKQVAHQVNARRLKIKGNVTVQLGTGNTNTDASRSRGQVATGQSKSQDFTRAGQGGGALATEPGASAGATTRSGVPAWLLATIGILVLLLVLAGLAYKFRARLFKPPV